MNIPKSLNIMGIVFQVTQLPGLSDENGCVLCGSCAVADRIIKINSALPSSTQQSTLLHEVVEALNVMMELEMPHRVISSLETGLYQVLTENKLLR